MVLKLIYYAVAARAEATRLILKAGKMSFEDIYVTTETWPEIKAQMPYGQVPVLQLEDGRQIAQSGAIERYAAKLAGLYPADPFAAAMADQTAFLVEEIKDALISTFHIVDLEEKIKARHELLAGPIKQKLLLLQKPLATHAYLSGDDLTFADFVTFSTLGWTKSGTLDGIPKTLLDDYPALKTWFNKMASLESIKAYYAIARPDRLTYQGA